MNVCLCVCVRPCHTFSGEESVSSLVAWTGGFAERGRETRLLQGLETDLKNMKSKKFIGWSVRVKLMSTSTLIYYRTSQNYSIE